MSPAKKKNAAQKVTASARSDHKNDSKENSPAQGVENDGPSKETRRVVEERGKNDKETNHRSKQRPYDPQADPSKNIWMTNSGMFD